MAAVGQGQPFPVQLTHFALLDLLLAAPERETFVWH